MNRLHEVLRSFSWAGLLFVAWIVFVSLPARLIGERSLWLFAIGTPAFMALVWISRRWRPAFGSRLTTWLENRAVQAAAFSAIVGILLRAAWVWAVPPVQTSDFREYWSLAKRLAETGDLYWIVPNGTHWYAYRAPGYTYFLAGCMKVFGEWSWIPALTNTVLYAATSWILFRLSSRLTGKLPAIAATALFAIWPNHIALTGIAAYEPLFMFLCLASIDAMIRSENRGSAWAIGSGLLNGLAVLVRPTVLLMPAVWLAYRLLGRTGRAQSVLHVSLATLAMAAVVAPWTLRNQSLGIPALVSTNGGTALMLTAFPGVTAEYVEEPVIALMKEVNWDEKALYAESSARAKRWIAENPWQWLRNNIERQAIFLGEDTAGFYAAGRVTNQLSDRAYSILQAIGHGWWAGIWFLTALGLLQARARFESSDGLQFAGWTVLLFVATAFPFCSVPRYHMPFVPLLLLVAGCCLMRRATVVEMPAAREAAARRAA